MRKFEKRIILFVFFLSIIFGINYSINHYLISSTPYIIDGSNNSLIVGDSRVKCALNPRYINRSVNIAQLGEPYIISFYKLKHILANNKNIKNILLSFHCANFSEYSIRKFNHPRWSMEFFERTYPIINLADFKKIKIKINKKKYFKNFIQKKLLINLNYLRLKLKVGKQKYPYIGKFQKSEVSRINEENVNTTINKHFFINDVNIGISQLAINYLDSIVTISQTNNIKLFLVNIPAHSEFLNKIPDNFNITFMELKDRLKEEKNVYILDLSNERLDDNYYRDYDHLNLYGANVISKKVNKMINLVDNNEFIRCLEKGRKETIHYWKPWEKDVDRI